MSDTSGTLSARTTPLYASGLMPAENRQHAQPGATPEAGDHDGAARLLTGQPPTPPERHPEEPLGKRRPAPPILANRPYCSAPPRPPPPSAAPATASMAPLMLSTVAGQRQRWK